MIVVDDDVDVFNLADVMGRWLRTCAPSRTSSSSRAPRARSSIRPPIRDDFTLTKMGIDATKPLGRDFAARLTILEEQRAR